MNRNPQGGGIEHTLGWLASRAKGGADRVQGAISSAAREELNQARDKALGRIAPVAKDTAIMAGGGVMAATGGAYILQGVTQLLSRALPRWLVSFLVGGPLVLGGSWLIRIGQARIERSRATSEEGGSTRYIEPYRGSGPPANRR